MNTEESVNFSFRDLQDAETAMYLCLPDRAEQVTEAVTSHTTPLLKLAEKFNANNCEKENCVTMAKGCKRLLILLKEPSNNENWMGIADFLLETGPNALKGVQDALSFAFTNRDVYNTSIMDIKPFCRKILETNLDETAIKEKHSEAIAAFLESLGILQPEVILVCHCESEATRRGLPSELYSLPYLVGRTEKWKNTFTGGGSDITIVNGVHPCYVSHEQDPRQKLAKRNLFYAGFMVAANVLAGRKVEGDGCKKLYNIAKHGTEDEPRLNPSYEESLEEFVFSLKTFSQVIRKATSRSAEYRDSTVDEAHGDIKDEEDKQTTENEISKLISAVETVNISSST